MRPQETAEGPHAQRADGGRACLSPPPRGLPTAVLVGAGQVGEWTSLTAQNPTDQINVPPRSQHQSGKPTPRVTGMASKGLPYSSCHLPVMSRWTQWSPTLALPQLWFNSWHIRTRKALGLTVQRRHSTRRHCDSERPGPSPCSQKQSCDHTPGIESHPRAITPPDGPPTRHTCFQGASPGIIHTH